MYALDDYPFEMRPMKPSEGGGYLISYPDFTECIADGETLEEALQNGREALRAVIETLQEHGLAVPAPNSGGVASGKFIARVPKSIHAQLALNAMVLTLIAKGLGQGTRVE
ncbi:type II toxin-antitoxin system HicB family antitoxin [Acidithiobacillus sp.]|uniref:type II toxin-antitoxin system HicB family antitoxin n=1 Tax=Acidithiobacillus sp. TaxID=1872118 RepID=UPI003D08DA44